MNQNKRFDGPVRQTILMSGPLTRCILPMFLSGLSALAGEYAVLANGFRLYAERHERQGHVVRLFLSHGTIELPAAQVTAFEKEDYAPPPSAEPVPPVKEPSPQEMVTRAAVRNGLPTEFVHSVAAVESGYRTDAVSKKGAMGLMQLMPETARQLSADPTDPEQNAEAGARYLRDLLLKYQNDPWQVRKALAGYNAGPGAVDRYQGIPPYPETQRYVERVLREHDKRRKK